MDELTEAEKRLQEIQMADLGTARREYISSVDKPNKFSRIRKEHLEASRLSNVDESVRRVAEQNKEKLSAWATFYKQVDDIGDLEDLDSMMDGQSHRAQLNAVIQESGGQTYVETPSERNRPRSQRAHGRDARGTGRGGGNVGRRGRGSFGPPIPSPPRQRSRGRVMMAGHQLAEIQRHLDPALDFNTGSPSRGRGRGGKDPKDHRPPPKAKPAGIKVRRPIQPQIASAPKPQYNYESHLAEPEGFLAAVRRTTSVSAESSEKEVQVTDAAVPEQLEGASSSEIELLDLHSNSGVITPAITENNQSLSSMKGEVRSLAAAEDEGSDDVPKLQQSSPPESIDTTRNVFAAEKSPEIMVSASLAGDDDEGDGTQKKQRTVKLFSTNLPQPQISISKSSMPHEAERPKTKLDENNDLLLDFSIPTSVVTDQQTQRIIPPSPAVQDLMDIDFSRRSRSPSKSVASLEKAPSPQEAFGSDSASEAEKTLRYPDRKCLPAEKILTPHAPRPTDLEPQPSPADISVVSYLQELALINDTIPTLTGEAAHNLNKRREKLIKLISDATEKKVAQNLALMSARKASAIISALESFSTSPPEDNSPLREKAERASRILRQGPDVDKTEAVSKTHAASPKRNRLLQAVLAAPFVPRSSSSSESPVRHFRKKYVPIPDDDDDHVIGEHVLPGRSRVSSTVSSGSVIRTTITDSNVDHLCRVFSEKLTFEAGPTMPLSTAPLSEQTAQQGPNNVRPWNPQKDLMKSIHADPLTLMLSQKSTRPHRSGENQSPAAHHREAADHPMPDQPGEKSQQQPSAQSPALRTRSLYASRYAV